MPRAALRFNQIVQRLRRYLPHAVGLGLATLMLWQGGEALEREAEGAEAFAVRVDAPTPVLELPADRARASKAGEPGDSKDALRWRARVRPPGELERVELRVDDRPVEARLRDPDTGLVELDLGELAEAPGWHFVEAGVERRGGRSERVVDPVLVGRFADSHAKPEAAPPCALSLSASPELLQDLVVPMLERELLPELRAVEHMGPQTTLEKAELELRDDAVRFELEVAGVNTLAVSGVVGVWISEDGQLELRLVTLSEVDFRGKLRNQARGIGAGSGALLGLIAPPLAPVGAVAGWWVADELVTKKARELVREQVDAGLAEISGLELLPAALELVPGRPASRVKLGFCEQTRVKQGGVVAGVWIAPDPEAAEARFELGAPGPLITGSRLTLDALGPDEDLRVELGVDVVNALLFHWTATGLLADLLDEPRALDHANGELASWTPLRLAGLRPTRPPVLAPSGGPEAGWSFGLAGLSIELEGVDDARRRWGELQVAVAGTLSPHWDAEAGTLSLSGSLDRLALTCVEDRPSASEDRQISGCFSELLEAAEVRERMDAHLRPGAEDLPSFALRELLADELGLAIDTLEMQRPRPGVLRLSASVRGGE